MSANVFVGNLDVLLSGINESVCSSLGIDTSLYMYSELVFYVCMCHYPDSGIYPGNNKKFVRGFIGEAKDLSLIQIGSSDKDLSPWSIRHSGIQGSQQLFIWHYWLSYAFRKFCFPCR